MCTVNIYIKTTHKCKYRLSNCKSTSTYRPNRQRHTDREREITSNLLGGGLACRATRTTNVAGGGGAGACDGASNADADVVDDAAAACAK